MKIVHFVGIDISKESFDASYCSEQHPNDFIHEKFANSASGCKQLLTWLKKHKVSLEQCFFAMEHTGWYTLELCCFLQDQKLAFALYSPLHLKRSLGLARAVPGRDKNDRVDAQRLAHYAFLHRHELSPTQLPSASLLKLKNLFAFRERLIKTQASLKQTIGDLKDSSHLIDNKFIIKQSEKQLKLIKQQVKQTEKQIEDAIKEDEQLQKSLKLLCSIPGIGLITAVALILVTNNFTAFSDSRKFASYCGVAPFEHTSGTSIRGRTKTSHLANKRIKALLSNGAASAIQPPGPGLMKN